MSRFIILICCFLFVEKDEPVITWRESYKLSWNDFKGEAHKNEKAVAITASGFSFEYSIKQNVFRAVSFEAKVEACFFSEQSWYKPELVNDYILSHEQLHYDITELYTRKFRQQLSQLKVSKTIKSDLESLHKLMNKQLESRQNDYDAETNNSINKEAQLLWQQKIETELQTLVSYKSE
ncbi:MAG: DUF922 domain-containing protein [Flavobacteriaceae bacterium]|nr:DUF922 domain-containing protein [Flavobacteriaceae bacterium]